MYAPPSQSNSQTAQLAPSPFAADQFLYTHSNDKDAVDNISISEKRALLVMHLAESKTRSNEQASAVVLLIKGLDLLHHCIKSIADYYALTRPGLPPLSLRSQPPFGAMDVAGVDADSQGDYPTEVKLQLLLQHAVQQFRIHFKHLQRVQASLGLTSPSLSASSRGHSLLGAGFSPSPQSGPVPQDSASAFLTHSPPMCAEKLLYDWGLQMAKDAALDEMMSGPSRQALKKYKRAYRVMEQLSLERGARLEDVAILRGYINDLGARIELVDKQLQDSFSGLRAPAF